MYTGLNNLGLTGLATSFSPSNLFTNGEGGVNLEVVTPEENALKQTMYQDYTGTTLVTAVEQPVGLWKDTSGNNNHSSQSSSTKRPILSARVNLLVKTEQFDDSAWGKTNVTVTANTANGPDGTAIIDKIVETTALGEHSLVQSGVASVSGVTYVGRVVAKAAERSILRLSFANLANSNVYFDLANGTKLTIGSAVLAATITGLGEGLYRVEASWTATGTSNYFTFGPASADNVATYTGDSAKGIYAGQADLRTADDAAKNIPAYQRVNTSTDYDTTGFPHYLKFDGIDDALQTGSIDLTSFDKVSVWAGSTKGSDSAASVLTEFTATSSTTAGSFAIFAPDSAASTYAFRSRGATLGTNAIASGYAAPNSYVVTGLGDISGDSQDIRIDGVSANTSTTDQGTGNFANDALNIGSRNNASLFHNGRLYSLTVRASTTPTSESAISSMNRYAGNLMKIFF